MRKSLSLLETEGIVGGGGGSFLPVAQVNDGGGSEHPRKPIITRSSDEMLGLIVSGYSCNPSVEWSGTQYTSGGYSIVSKVDIVWSCD